MSSENAESSASDAHSEPSDDLSAKRRKIKDDNLLHKRNQLLLNKLLYERVFKQTDLEFEPDEINEDNYNPDSLHFVRSLHEVATEPLTSEDYKDFVLQIRQSNNKLVMCELILDSMENPMIASMTIVDNASKLSRALAKPFNLIFAPATTKLAPHQDWTIEKQINSLGLCSGDVHQPIREATSDGAMTHTVSIEVLTNCFLKPELSPHDHMGSNFLDMANVSKRNFLPPALTDVSLLDQIERRHRGGSWSRDSLSDAKRDDWIIMTRGPSDSPFHADTGGKCTAIAGLAGTKRWFVPNGDWHRNKELFLVGGTRYVDYPDGVMFVDINPGDCIIQAPGTIHAVYTKGNAMVVGCFFYTAAHFARTITCITSWFLEELHDNDDMKARDWEELNTIVANLDLDDLFTADQVTSVFAAIGEMLRRTERIVHDQEAGWKPAPSAPARSKKDDDDDKRAPLFIRRVGRIPKAKTFLKTCCNWWMERHQAQLAKTYPE